MSRPRVLVVDAEERYAKTVASALAETGLEVRACGDVGTARALADRHGLEVLVINARLPGTGTQGLVESLRALNPPRPIGVLYTLPADLIGGVSRNATQLLDDFVLKPSTIGEVVARVHALLGRFNNLPPPPRAERGTRPAGPLEAVARARRQQLTIMFADVRGFTRFSENRDPETVASGLNDLFEYLASGVTRFDGVVDKFIGDGMMALFGLRTPRDHEVAAVLAAQEIMVSVTETQTSQLLTGAQLDLGIGLHTGEVVIGPLGPRSSRDATAVGSAVNLASRLCNEARGGEIIVSETTFGHVRETVAVREQRTVRLKGMAEPLRIYSLQPS